MGIFIVGSVGDRSLYIPILSVLFGLKATMRPRLFAPIPAEKRPIF